MALMGLEFTTTIVVMTTTMVVTMIKYRASRKYLPAIWTPPLKQATVSFQFKFQVKCHWIFLFLDGV